MNIIDKHIAVQIFQAASGLRDTERTAENLSASQLRAMFFFTHANHHSRTVSGFARFSSVTQATASVIVKNLVESGYLIRKRSDIDKRKIHLSATKAGAAMASSSPLANLANAVNRSLSPDTKNALAQILQLLVKLTIESEGTSSFGTCKYCRYLRTQQQRSHCSLFERPLSDSELEQICGDFGSP